MILLNVTGDGYSPRHTAWMEQKVKSIDELVAQIEKSLETEDDYASDREYEVICVEVVRRVKVSRRVERKAIVSVAEVEEVAA